VNYLALKSILCNSKRSLHVIIAVSLSVSIIYSSFVVADGFVRRVEGMTMGYAVTDLLYVIEKDSSLADAMVPELILSHFSSNDRAMGVVKCEVYSDEYILDLWGVDLAIFRDVRRPRITGVVPSEAGEVLVGSSLADLYGVEIGSVVEVRVGEKYFELLVSGIASTSGQYDMGLISSLETARLLRPEMGETYSLIEAKVNDASSILESVDLSPYDLSLVQSLAMQDYMRGVAGEVRQDLYLLSLVLAFLSLISVSHTMYKILGDSMKDLFILRSLGLTKWGLIQTIVADSVLLSFAGALLGLLLGNLLSNAASLFSFLALKTVFLPIRYDEMLFAYCLVLSLFVGVSGGIISVLLKRPVKEAYGVLKTV
jgi:hypothetical protein